MLKESPSNGAGKELKKLLVVYGTRPEAIKMAPVVAACASSTVFDTKVIVSGQHDEMLEQVHSVFNFTPDVNYRLMTKKQSLVGLSAEIFRRLDVAMDEEKPDLVLVHGDTTTAMCAAVSAFYKGIAVGHVEAGLRTASVASPFPEEFNRRTISQTARLHFCPTEENRQTLVSEGVDQASIFVTGNTAIDSLLFIIERDAASNSRDKGGRLTKIIGEPLGGRRLILITAHRRENIGKKLDEILKAIEALARANQNTLFVYPLHPNPKLRAQVVGYENFPDNLRFIEPQPYTDFCHLMSHSYLIMSDSGGVQEEAPSLNKPVVVMRDETERQEGVEAGALLLAGSEKGKIISIVQRLMDDQAHYNQIAMVTNPYGDGNASKRIVREIEKFLLA